MELTGSVAFVTGASGGLGAHVCRRLVDEQVRVAVGYRDGRDRADALCAALRDIGGEAEPVQVDHTDPASVAASVSAVEQHFGALDILVNSAGMASGSHSIAPGDLEAFTPEIWDEMVRVNLNGPYYLTRAATPLLRASRWGRVVNVGSTIGHGTWGGAAAYAPSKGAVVSLTRFLAAALAPDITVNCVSPGLMEGTRMSGGAPEDFVASWKDRAALRATTGLDDVAQQIVSFCKSATMTGQEVIVDGGIHFH
ncbi:SDR family NAD(P)-dependent oxidoreductase [Maritimibacter sp. UBA3975]|uniref:SDR family NAD(P)-dependent oxidoreductase n=1 Tax=Maritimibacter sp. UBA3975 TaxID=1946833 RepID=UPI000C0A72C2|nr:SDR family NAD(P)-dependent oxidoreductase [Maritimibacter sp. UBA3975]MAM63587.1 dehydrogenase [Maritimibacter sp.]|tara:strand:- start:19777 stop:20535 length:759 start_codon:yes stop_codon:yes gene_type:complete